MLRQLPETITADATPDWLPVGWIVHSTSLKRGRQTKSYTQLRTGKKLSTKDQVLEYMRMEKVRQERESGILRKKANLDKETASERLSLLPDVSGENQNNMCVNTSDGCKILLKEKVLIDENNTLESEASSSEEEEEEDELDCNQIAYVIEEDEEDFSESESVENVENVCDITSTTVRSQPERIQKLESRAKTKCVFDDEDMSSDSDNKLLPEVPEAETSKEDNASAEMREIAGLTGSFTLEVNLDFEPASDRLVEKESNKSGTEGIIARNIEIIDLESDLMDTTASSNDVEVTHEESGDKSEEPLAQEEIDNELRRSVFFPDIEEAPSCSVLVFDSTNIRSSAEDLSDTVEVGLNLQEYEISGSEKRKKGMEECSSNNLKKKDTEAQTKKLQKGKTPPTKRQGKKGKTYEWLEPCPSFAFEPLTRSFQVEDDDSVIHRYLEQHFTAPGNDDDTNLPLPDFGLPSFSNINISLNEEPEPKRNKSPGPPCVHVASSSLPSWSSTGTSMQQRVT